LLGQGDALALHPWSLEGAGILCAGLHTERALPMRRLRAWMGGREGVEVLQIGARSWASAQEKDLSDLVDALVASDLPDEPCAGLTAALLGLLEPSLSERAAGAYVRGVLLAELGRDDEACAMLEPLAGKARPEAFWHLYRLHARRGRGEAARSALDAYLRHDSRRSRFQAVAQALREPTEG
jgi:hypothetical protein